MMVSVLLLIFEDTIGEERIVMIFPAWFIQVENPKMELKIKQLITIVMVYLESTKTQGSTMKKN